MSMVVVDKSICKKDGACVAVCPSQAIVLDAEGYPAEAPKARCIQCGHCVAVCPAGAIKLPELPDEPMLPLAAERPAPAIMDNFLNARRSVREFKNKPLGPEIIADLLDVARRAPTAVNLQQLHWIAVDGKEKVHAVAEEVLAGLDPKMRSPRALELFASGHDFLLRNAPTLLVVCAPKDSAWAWSDSAIAISYLELAAAARGIGACWAGFLIRTAQNHEPLNKLLAVPEGFGIFGALMLGWGKYTYKRIPPRKPLSMHWV